MQRAILIGTAVLALSSFRVAGETYCGALEQSNPDSPSITSVSGTVTVPSDLSQYDGSGFRAYVGITGQSCIDDYVQVNLDINVVDGAPTYTVIFDKYDVDAARRYLERVTDIQCDRVQLSLTVSLDGTEGTMTAQNLNNGQSRTANLSNNGFTCRSFATWMFDSWSNTDLTDLEMQFDDCVYSRNGGTPIAGISSSTLVSESCTVERDGNDGIVITN